MRPWKVVSLEEQEDQLRLIQVNFAKKELICQCVCHINCTNIHKNYDISSFTVSSVEECYEDCVNEPTCVGFVVNDCDSTDIYCWLKSYVGATDAEDCRCWGTIDREYEYVLQCLFFNLKRNLWNQTQYYLNYILEHQESSGWIGPDDDPDDGNIYWGRFDVLQAFTQWAEAEVCYRITLMIYHQV